HHLILFFILSKTMLASSTKGENGIMSSQNARTIIQRTRSLSHYDFEKLDSSTLQVFKDIFDHLKYNKDQLQRSYILLKLFECYLQVTDQEFNFHDSTYLQLDSLIRSFIGALWSNKFLIAVESQSHSLTTLFLKLLDYASLTKFLSINQSTATQNEIKKYSENCIELFEKMQICHERVYYWQGWWTFSKKNVSWFVPLNGVYKCYGREFTELLYFKIDTAFSRGTGSIRDVIPNFCRWLPISGYTAEQFNDSSSVQILFHEYLKFYLASGYQSGEGRSIKALIVSWRGFVAFVENNFIGSIFAEPFGKIISPEPTSISGKERRIKKTSGGIEVKEKLLTEIPLYVTDEKAFELLFCQIQRDVNHVVSVAEKLSDDLWQRYQKRIMLSKKGVVKPLKNTTTIDEEFRCRIIHKNNPNWLANAAATFEHHGFTLEENDDPIIFTYTLPLSHIVYELGLPTSYALLPYMVLLVYEHPNIVPSFLTEFELYNKQGKLTGFVKLDSAYVLDGRKMRRGPNNAQQIITLTEKSLLLIKKIISITDCVRNDLKKNGNDNWRYLFLSCKKGFILSRMSSQYTGAKKGKGTFFQELSKETNDMQSENAEKLSSRFMLNALRSSKAVLVYLETRSVSKMAKTLGHKEYCPKLLSCYLPESILDFFQSRWIRIFQQGIIVEAMKDSPFILDATKFNTIHEFHEFMKNHALKIIPAHLENGSNEREQSYSDNTGEIIFNINAGILALLLSLQYAVCNAKKQVCGIAAYWAEVTTHLVRHIESGSKHASNEEFKSHLKSARCQMNPEKMEAIIYA
ncbi:MAG: hypothetical protein Q8L78_06440, partial [Coxiellaceae bacterium]|nr:hypothetical protein [Coxiellaceae bacterium]